MAMNLRNIHIRDYVAQKSGCSELKLLNFGRITQTLPKLKHIDMNCACTNLKTSVPKQDTRADQLAVHVGVFVDRVTGASNEIVVTFSCLPIVAAWSPIPTTTANLQETAELWKTLSSSKDRRSYAKSITLTGWLAFEALDQVEEGIEEVTKAIGERLCALLQDIHSRCRKQKNFADLRDINTRRDVDGLALVNRTMAAFTKFSEPDEP